MKLITIVLGEGPASLLSRQLFDCFCWWLCATVVVVAVINVTVATSPDTEETIVCCTVGRRRLRRFGAAVVLFAVLVGNPVAMVEGSVVGRLAVAGCSHFLAPNILKT